MQPRNWDDLRFLLAIRRGQTLIAAARQMRVDDTTVSRRLAVLQSDLGMQLVQRRGDGKWMLTEFGEAVARRAEAMEQHFQSIGPSVAERDAWAGTVRVTSVPILVNRLFVGSIRDLIDSRPGLMVELIPDSRDLSLTRREADVAVRLARPVTGGTQVKARRVGALHYGVYAARTVRLHEAARLPWITYEDAMSHLPQARWMSRAAKGRADSLSRLRVRDAETALEAAAAGIGRTLVPAIVADRDARLGRLDATGGRRLPSREIWLLAHADQLELARVRAVVAWLERVLAASRAG